MLKRLDLTRGRDTGATERGRDWAGGQFLSLRGDPVEHLFVIEKYLPCLLSLKQILSCAGNEVIFFRQTADNDEEMPVQTAVNKT